MNGFVYVQTNDAEHNEVVVFGRKADGTLERLSGHPTGGKGTGAPHLPSQSSVVLDGGHLFVTNAGSDDVTVFAVEGAELRLLERTPSGGSMPRSVAVHGSWVYVLNTADEPNIAGFTVDGARLGSQTLPEGSDPAQVAFSPDGSTLLVTDRATDSIHAFAVDARGAAQDRVAHRSSGATPYGFDVTADGVVVVTEAAGAQVGRASASSYRLDGAMQLAPVSGAVGNTRSEVCWAVVSNDGRVAFVTNFGDGTISTYAIGDDGSIELREAVAATTVEGRPGIRDEALSSDGQYLYALHSDTGRVFGWKVGEEGSL
ncbi:MAG TPA: beta-propeller fold lactonase family protein, partial [Gaiellaceae bacterium]|nr:beta-propeller fold lactonase family protein [Gaiellaceae bacterium]